MAFEAARDGRACDAIAAKAVQDRAIEARRPGEARVDMKRAPVARKAVDERGARRPCGAGVRLGLGPGDNGCAGGRRRASETAVSAQQHRLAHGAISPLIPRVGTLALAIEHSAPTPRPNYSLSSERCVI